VICIYVCVYTYHGIYEHYAYNCMYIHILYQLTSTISFVTHICTQHLKSPQDSWHEYILSALCIELYVYTYVVCICICCMYIHMLNRLTRTIEFVTHVCTHYIEFVTHVCTHYMRSPPDSWHSQPPHRQPLGSTTNHVYLQFVTHVCT